MMHSLNIKPMISSRVSQLSSSSTLKITALTKKLKKEGKDVVNFAAGEPDFDTPQFIKEKAKLAIDQGLTKYTPSAGTIELREAICRKLKEENNIPCEASNIIVTSGLNTLFCRNGYFLKQGDEVLIPLLFGLVIRNGKALRSKNKNYKNQAQRRI
jgi:aspartate aminotransferase